MARQLPVLTGKASDFLKVGAAAAGRGDLDTLRALLGEKPEWLTRVASHGRTLLWEAAYKNRLPVVEFLTNAGADINARGCHFTPLLVELSPWCAARFRSHDAVADFLLDAGARRDAYDAAYLGERDTVLRLLDTHPGLATTELPQHDPNVRTTLLHYAVAPGHTELVKDLLERGADPAPYSQWLLRFCIWREHVAILELLIAAGATVDCSEVPRSGITNPRLLEILATAGAPEDPNYSEGGWPPLVFQCRGDRGGSAERVQALIDAGADVNMRNHKGQSALHVAAKAGFGDIVQLLVDTGAEVNCLDGKGESPLACAIRSTVKDKDRLIDVITRLVEGGARPDLASGAGISARRAASRKRDSGVWLDALGD